jgi:hypothetical protein
LATRQEARMRIDDMIQAPTEPAESAAFDHGRKVQKFKFSAMAERIIAIVGVLFGIAMTFNECGVSHEKGVSSIAQVAAKLDTDHAELSQKIDTSHAQLKTSIEQTQKNQEAFQVETRFNFRTMQRTVEIVSNKTDDNGKVIAKVSGNIETLLNRPH